ncbi:MAG: hypothetical protein NTX24_02560 [Candidatus Pacearchaeota archaeon]|nr:hypothetical protein [Candidatus Pacearchaeota archaeon]
MNVKSLILGAGIVIVFALLLWYGFETFYPSPQYEKFCNNSNGGYSEPMKAPYACSSVNCTFSQQLQNETDQCYGDGGQPTYNHDENGCSISLKKCDFCNKSFEEAMKKRGNLVFVFSLIIGIIVLLIGYLLLSTEPIGISLIASGVWALFYGAINNWRNLVSVWKFLLLLIAFIVIIFLAFKVNRKNKKF